MLKMFVLWLLLQPIGFIAPSPTIKGIKECDCPAVTNLQKTGETTNSFSFSWTGNTEATSYEVWYERDNFTSTVSTVATTSHIFINLSPGYYTFYVRAVCEFGSSGFIGIEALVES